MTDIYKRSFSSFIFIIIKLMFVRLATKCDLTTHNVISNDDTFVNEAEGKELQNKIEAKALFSCSSLLNMQLSEMFQMMVDLAHEKKENETKPPSNSLKKDTLIRYLFCKCSLSVMFLMSSFCFYVH